MKVTIETHTDGLTQIITYISECHEDCVVNATLFARYDGTGLIGSASSDGKRLQLIILPLTPAEIERHRQADAMIESLNLSGAKILVRTPGAPGGNGAVLEHSH